MICQIFSQSFNRLFYLNSFNSVLLLFKIVLNNFYQLVAEDFDFSPMMGKNSDSNSKYRNNHEDSSKLIIPKGAPQSQMNNESEALNLQNEHYFFLRKIISVYIETLDKGLGSMAIDYSIVLNNFIDIIKAIRPIYPQLQMTIIYSFTNLINSIYTKMNYFDPEDYSKLFLVYTTLVDDVLYQNIEFYRGESNILIEITPEKLNLS